METDEKGAAVVDVVEAALKALMPLFRNFGVSHHDLSRRLARLYVYDTEEVLKAEGHPTTSARLALMTGLTRGETEKYLDERGGDLKRRQERSNSMFAPGVVLTVWNSDARFSTPYGVALELDLQPSSSRRRTFQDLVAAATPDVDSEAVLDQLLAAGCVEVHEQNFVRCTSRAYVPAGISVDRISRAGYALIALARTITQNLLEIKGPETLIERGVVSDFLVSPQGRSAIRKWVTEDGTRFLETFDAWLTNSRAELEGDGAAIGIEMFMYEKANDLTSAEAVSKSS